MCSKTAIVLLTTCLSVFAFARQGASERSTDAQTFLAAQNLSDGGHHDEARARFRQYKQDHPQDLLVPLRMGYDYLLDSRPRTGQQAHADYLTALGFVSDAIRTFEKNGNTCVGTDIQGISNGTIDCNYVGAGLYSLREALILKNETKHIHEMDDDRHLRAYAGWSGSPQSKFLLGVHEYEESIIRYKGIRIAPFIAVFERTTIDQNDGLNLIASSLTKETVFSDDGWFYVLKLEIDRRPGYERFAKDPRYSIDAIKKRLRAKYPDNGILK
jgi:hypothetical protein